MTDGSISPTEIVRRGFLRSSYLWWDLLSDIEDEMFYMGSRPGRFMRCSVGALALMVCDKDFDPDYAFDLLLEPRRCSQALRAMRYTCRGKYESHAHRLSIRAPPANLLI